MLDWAGTMLDHGSLAPLAAFLEVFRLEGVLVTPEEARAFMGMHKRDHLKSIAGVPRVGEEWRKAKGSDPAEADIDRMYAAFSPIQIGLLPRFSELIPGALEAVEKLRARRVKIGSNTGYSAPMMEVVLAEARKQGLEVDAMVCADDVPEGRPAPWMAFEVARRLGVYPPSALVKVDDTVAGVKEGLNAGMWSVGVARTGNEMGLSVSELEAMPLGEIESRLEAARGRLSEAGAHFVIGGLDELPACVEEIDRRLSGGEKP